MENVSKAVFLYRKIMFELIYRVSRITEIQLNIIVGLIMFGVMSLSHPEGWVEI